MTLSGMSLFSGVAGFDMGFDAAGVTTMVQSEIHVWCQRVLRYRYPHTILVPDVRDVCTYNGHVDIMYGGFPCQDASVAGGREGFAGKHTSLWRCFRDAIEHFEPTWVVAENVPGLLSVRQGRDFGEILNNLDDFGYSVAWVVLDAQHFGLPQQRRSLFIVAHRTASERYPAYVLDHAQSSGWDTTQVCKVGCIENGEPATCGHNSDTGDTRIRAYNGAHPTDVAFRFTANEGPRLAPTSETLVIDEARPLDVRNLSSIERERAMGWNDDWTRWGLHENGELVEVPHAQRWRMTGNGVARPVAQFIAQRLVHVHEHGLRDV